MWDRNRWLITAPWVCDRNESQSLIWGFEKIISHASSSHSYIICIAEEQIAFGSSQGSGPVTSAAPQPFPTFQKVWDPALSSCISCTLRGTPRPLQAFRVSESPCGIPGIVLPTPAQTKMPARSLALATFLLDLDISEQATSFLCPVPWAWL